MIKKFISGIDFVTYINNKKAFYFDLKYLSLTKKFIEKIFSFFIEKILSRYIIQFIKKKREIYNTIKK